MDRNYDNDYYGGGGYGGKSSRGGYRSYNNNRGGGYRNNKDRDYDDYGGSKVKSQCKSIIHDLILTNLYDNSILPQIDMIQFSC